MTETRTPRWLNRLEKHLRWLAVPNIAILFVTLQAAGFLLVSMNRAWIPQLALIPEAVFAGEYWRLVTFLSLPISLSPFWVIFVLWFIYFILNGIESVWGDFKTTLYVLVSILVTITYSLALSYPVFTASHFESTLFLAAAALFPEMEVRLFFLLPVKMKWLAVITGVFVLIEFAQGGWMDRFFLVAIYSNYLIFFGPAALSSIRQAWRRSRFRRKMR